MRAVESVESSCMALLLPLKLNGKLLAPLDDLSLPLLACAALRLCRIRQYEELVDFNFDMKSSPCSVPKSDEQFSKWRTRQEKTR